MHVVDDARRERSTGGNPDGTVTVVGISGHQGGHGRAVNVPGHVARPIIIVTGRRNVKLCCRRGSIGVGKFGMQVVDPIVIDSYSDPLSQNPSVPHRCHVDEIVGPGHGVIERIGKDTFVGMVRGSRIGWHTTRSNPVLHGRTRGRNFGVKEKLDALPDGCFERLGRAKGIAGTPPTTVLGAGFATRIMKGVTGIAIVTVALVAAGFGGRFADSVELGGAGVIVKVALNGNAVLLLLLLLLLGSQRWKPLEK